MADGHPPNANPWGVALFRTLRATDPRSATEQAAYSKYLDQRADQEMARRTASTVRRGSYRRRCGSCSA